ncbi:DUF4266 domain-containing protein [Gammaproteobacteria bacterium]|nr:DUF4266 domain-containing protein [Gammaproteobacteria bacterium]
MKVKLVISLCVVCLLSLAACETVQPWERGTLAKPEMQLSEGLNSSLYDQVYDSKEASSGGSGAAGAGCGCN